jgi:hypothetical protein
VKYPTVLISLVLLLAVLAVSGCGDNQTASEKWADDVCSSTGDWVDTMSSIRNDLTKKARDGTLNVNDLRSGLERAANETQSLVRELREAGPPKTAAGNRASDRLNAVVSKVKRLLESARSKAENADSLQDALVAAAPDLAQAASEVDSGVRQIVEDNPAGEVRDAFRDTKSCQELRD